MPYRQWAPSLPWELRLPVARDPALLNAVSRVFLEEVREWLRAIAGPTPGARVEAAANRGRAAIYLPGELDPASSEALHARLAGYVDRAAHAPVVMLPALDDAPGATRG